jgi:hypothetical protein
MRPRQAILLTIGVLGAGLVGASVQGVTAVNADLENMSSARQQLHRVLDREERHDCPLRDRKPQRSTPSDTEI